jgi:hypothetical protein
MSRCAIEHCPYPAVYEHPVYRVALCPRCRTLIDRFGYPRTLGDLSSLVMLLVLQFGTGRVHAALEKLKSLA